MSGTSAFGKAFLWVFLIVLAWGFTIGETAAGADRVDSEEFRDAITSPVEEVPESEYDSFLNETDTNASVEARVDTYGALVILPRNSSGFAANTSSNFIHSGVSTMMFPATISGPWGYEHPDRARGAAALCMLAWLGQVGYTLNKYRAGGRPA